MWPCATDTEALILSLWNRLIMPWYLGLLKDSIMKMKNGRGKRYPSKSHTATPGKHGHLCCTDTCSGNRTTAPWSQLCKRSKAQVITDSESSATRLFQNSSNWERPCRIYTVYSANNPRDSEAAAHKQVWPPWSGMEQDKYHLHSTVSSCQLRSGLANKLLTSTTCWVTELWASAQPVYLRPKMFQKRSNLKKKVCWEPTVKLNSVK